MNRLSGLRRGAAKAGGGKSKSKGGFFAKWTPPSFDGANGVVGQMSQQETRSEVQAADPIILLPGEYPDAYNPHPVTGQPSMGEMFAHRAHRYQHYYKNQPAGFRSLTCTRGPDPHSPQPCVGCLLIDRKELDEKASGTRNTWIVNMAHLTPYYETQLIKDGQAQTRQDGSALMVKRECKQGTIGNRVYWTKRAARDNKASAQCDGCAQRVPHVLGDHRFWELGKGHLNALLDFNDKVLANICYYTNTGIIKRGFVCGNCSNPLMDIASSQFTNEQIKQYEDVAQPCPQCQTQDLPKADYESGFDAHGMSKIAGYQPPVDAAGQPVAIRPLDIFDVVLWVQREGEGTSSKPTIKKWERITQAPFGEGGASIDLTASLEHIVPKVFDFEDLFSTTPEKQAKDLNRPNPYVQQQQAQAGYPTPAPAAMGGYPTVPPPQPPQPGYAPPQAVPTAAPGIPASYAPVPAAAPAAYPAPAPSPMAQPVAQPMAYPTAAPVAAPPAVALPTPAPQPGPPAAPPAAPPVIAAPYPQAPVPTAPAPAGGPPQPGNRPNWGNDNQ